MPRVTALREERRDRVRVELDGAPWRTLPAAAVVAAGLMVGVEVDRERARELRRAVRRTEALTSAAGALSRRDRSAAGLDAALERRGIAAPERADAVETLSRLGYLDDARFAAGRAAALAARGFGDEAIRFDLDRQGLDGERIEAAVASLEPEAARAAAIAGREGTDARTARRLAARGFSAESIESALGVLDS
jgi:SOS response regulatory protein OraA/RecX